MRRRALCLWLVLSACSDPAKPDEGPIEHERIHHVVDEARVGLATGDFQQAALEHGTIQVDAKYRHVLNFLLTPMLPPSRKPVPSAGPLILFSDDRDVIVFSPTNHFYASLIWFENQTIHYGIEGEIDQIPAGFAHDFIMVKGHGINRTVEAWGALVRDGKPAPDRYADIGIGTLGYWTDNGAYYYYKTEAGMNEAQTLLDVKRDADMRGLPYGYFQLDSWWYKKAPGNGLGWGGLLRWEPLVEMFPDGLVAFRDQLGLPLVLHNRWFAPDNEYTGAHDFVPDGGPNMALPADGAIFDELMRNAKTWGAITYEQDWLIPQFWGIPHLRNGVDHTETWMRHIDAAARAQGLTTQLTMGGAAHLMDAVNLPAVTSVRTSIDYAPESRKSGFWPQFHTVNMIAGALGLWPFKDNFQSSETWGEEEALISALSAGPVGVGDRIGASKPEWILPTCRSDGVLLKPSRPATPIDAMFLTHTRPYLTHTYSDHALGRWHYLAAFQIERGDEDRQLLDNAQALFAYDGALLEDMFVIPDRITNWSVVLQADLGIDHKMVAYDWQSGEAQLVESAFELRPIAEAYRHRYIVLAPVLENELALIGEPTKYVTMADRRFTALSASDDALEITLSGAPGESVELLGFDARGPGLLPRVTVELDAEGVGQAIVGR